MLDVSPRSLWLGEAERVAVLENRSVFTRNGYDIKVDDESGQLSIIAQPVGADGPSGTYPSGVTCTARLTKIILSAIDVEELAVGILAGDDRNTLRPSRHLARCASKACRRAVMVGDPLPLAQMEKVSSGMCERAPLAAWQEDAATDRLLSMFNDV